MAVEFYYPKTFKEINDYKFKRFLLKVSTSTCPPCKTLHTFLENYKTDKQIPVMCIDAFERTEIFKNLQVRFKFRGVPFYGVFGEEMREVTTSNGYSEEVTLKMLEDFDVNKEVPEPKLEL